jgi:adenosylcobinamide-GDP ribazoletransferase
VVLTALRGALGFLSRLPVGRDERAWEAFRDRPAALPLAGYVVGAVVALPLALPLPAPTAAVAFAAWLYLVTGVTHTDGVADLGDALAAHGDAADRRAVMRDTSVGAGGALSLVVVVLGVATAGYALAAAPLRLLALVVAAEVGAKAGMAAVACLGTATHEGLGASLTDGARPRDLAVPLLVALPAAAATWPHPAAAAALAASAATTAGVLWAARRSLGGVGGDVFGATNELARVVALHAGVVAWTHF